MSPFWVLKFIVTRFFRENYRQLRLVDFSTTLIPQDGNLNSIFRNFLFVCFTVEIQTYIYTLIVQLEVSVGGRGEAEGPLKPAGGLRRWLQQLGTSSSRLVTSVLPLTQSTTDGSESSRLSKSLLPIVEIVATIKN